MLSAIDPHFTKTFELKQHHSSLRETALDSLITSTLLPMGCSSRPCPSWSSHAPCERSSATRTWPRSCVVEIVRSAISPLPKLFLPLAVACQNTFTLSRAARSTAHKHTPEQEELQSRPGHFLHLRAPRSAANVGTRPDAQPWRQDVEVWSRPHPLTSYLHQAPGVPLCGNGVRWRLHYALVVLQGCREGVSP
jgi:hypothetical protein